jgi:hypothetical protein
VPENPPDQIIYDFPSTLGPAAPDLGGNKFHHSPEGLAPLPGDSHDRPFDQGQGVASLVSLLYLVSLVCPFSPVCPVSLAKVWQPVRPQQPHQIIQLLAYPGIIPKGKIILRPPKLLERQRVICLCFPMFLHHLHAASDPGGVSYR